MFTVALFAVLLTMALALIRALRGPSLFDRILAVNMFGTSTVLGIAVLGFVTDRPAFLDIALVYALISFITTIATLKYFEYGSLGRDRQEESR
jgi:multicomponent Na+:H+ antiporter subunit F